MPIVIFVADLDYKSGFKAQIKLLALFLGFFMAGKKPYIVPCKWQSLVEPF